MENENKEKDMKDVADEVTFTEAPLSINIKGYYHGFSVMVTKRLEEDQITPQLDGITAVIQKMIDKGFKPSWNDQTNGSHSNGAATTKAVNTRPQVIADVTCEVCGQPAKEKKGLTKSGKQYHGVFCSTEDRSHTRWRWNG